MKPAQNFNKLILLAFLLLSFRLSAQVEFQVIPDSQNDSIGKAYYSSFGGIATDVININGHYFVCPGLTMGMVFNNKILVGGYVNFLVNHTHVETSESRLFDVKYEYGGVWLGYIGKPIKNLQLGFSSKFGKGDVTLEKDNKLAFRDKQFLMVTPQIDLHLRATKWMRFFLSSGFRLTTDLKLEPVNKRYFDGPNTTVGVLFGQ